MQLPSLSRIPRVLPGFVPSFISSFLHDIIPGLVYLGKVGALKAQQGLVVRSHWVH